MHITFPKAIVASAGREASNIAFTKVVQSATKDIGTFTEKEEY